MSTGKVTIMAEEVLIILINISCQLALIFALARLMMVILRIRSASVRRAIWLAVVLCPLVLAPMNLLSSNVAFFHVSRRQGDVATYQRADLNTLSSQQISRSEPVGGGSLDTPTPFWSQVGVSLYRYMGENLAPLLIFVWLFGVGISFVLTYLGFLGLRRLTSQCSQVENEAVLRVFDHVREEVGISRGIRLFASKEVQTPLSIGFAHPRVILPEWMLNSHGKLRMILIHEIAHLRQLDDLVNLLCQLIGAFLFFHPLFHLAVRELRLSNEEVCDGYAVRLTGARTDYVDCLVEFSCAHPGRLSTGLGQSGGLLIRRAKAIFKAEEGLKMIGKRTLMLLSLSVFALTLMISYVRLIGTASAGEAEIDRFQTCVNHAGPGMFKVDTTNGKIWWLKNESEKGKYLGQPESISEGEVGTYIPYESKSGGGLFILNTTTGEAWWTNGEDWSKPDVGKPGSEKDEVGAYIPYENKSGAGFFILNTKTGEVWWTNGSDSEKPDVGRPEKVEEIGTYIPRKNDRGAGFFILNTKTGEVWWTNGSDSLDPTESDAAAGEIGTPEQFILRISDPDPGMSYGTMVLNDQIVSMEMLLGNFQRGTPKQKEMLIIQSERDVCHDQIVEVMDLAKRADIKKIGFAMVARY